MKLYFLFVLSLISQLLFGQTNSSRFTTKWVNAEDGLKQLCVKYCIPDNDGYIWMATELGLYRYDGSGLIEIKDERYPNLSKQRITRLGKDNVTGKIHFYTYPDNCQYEIDGNKIKEIDPKKIRKNVIYNNFGTSYSDSSPLYKSIAKNKQYIKIMDSYNGNAIRTAVLTNNFLYIQAFENLGGFAKNGRYTNLNSECTSGVVFMKFDEFVISIDKDRINLMKEGKIINKPIKVDPIIQSYIDRIFKVESNIQIFGFKNQYFLKHNNDILKISYKNGALTTSFLFESPADDITFISFLEKENVYYIGTQTKGMAVLKPILFNCVLINNNKTNKSINFCYSVANISDDEWFSTSGWFFNPKKKEIKLDVFFKDYRSFYFILPYKNRFYSIIRNDLWNINNNKNDYGFNLPKLLKQNFKGFSGYTFHKGQLYLTNYDEIYFLKDNTLKTDNALNNKFKGRDIKSICSFNDFLIVTTSKGVYTYYPDTNKLSVIKGLEKVNARYIKLINKNSFWVGCYGDGLFLVDKQKVYKVKDNTIELTTAHAIEEDKAGNLWISTNDGLLKTEKNDAIQKILKNQPLDCYKYSTEDGLLTNEFNGGGTHPSLQTKDGIIGFPSMKGFVWFNPKQMPKQLFKGSIVMDKVVVDNKKIISLLNNNYWFANETGIITFNFSYAYFYNRENLTISYRFEDQPNWTDIKGSSFQIGRYKKGKQQLLIRIYSHGFDKKQQVIKSFPLYFEARYYETFWFWGLCLFLFVLFLYSAYQIGLRLNMRREELLKHKIEEKTIELQQSLTELANSNEIVLISLEEKNILLKEIHHRVKNNLQLVMSLLNIQARDKEFISIEDFLEKGQSRIASMVLIHENLYQKENVGKVDFQDYCFNLAQNVSSSFGEKSKNITIEVEANEIYFDIQTAIPLGLIINELVSNALKHAFPNNRKGSVKIIITKKKDNAFELIISDNGIGLESKSKIKKSMGLELVSLLALQLKGTLEVSENYRTEYKIIFKEVIIFS